jgi:drug/metabolite transporter (DMT)-like permease
MKKAFLLWAFFLMSSLVINGLSVRALAMQGIPYYESLSSRGFFCLCLVLIFALKKRLTLMPKSLKTQALRGVLAGLALSAFTISYDWLSASSVSVLSNIDVPLLLALGPLIGIPARKSTRIMSLLSISFLVLYVYVMEPGPHLHYGLITLGLGSFLLCLGYLFIKKSMKDENEAVTILVPSIAILIYGLILHENGPTWMVSTYFISFLSGASMFGAYYATMRLYTLTDLASAEFPTLVSSIIIQPLEAFFLQEELKSSHLILSLCFIVTVYLILSWEKKHA